MVVIWTAHEQQQQQQQTQYIAQAANQNKANGDTVVCYPKIKTKSMNIGEKNAKPMLSGKVVKNKCK